MKTTTTTFLAALAVITLNSLSVLAAPKPVDPDALKLAPPFSDHMVLQREMPVPVWGTAKPGEKVTVTFAGQTKTVTVAEDRKWMVKLDPLKASAEGRVLSVRLDGVSVQVSGVSGQGSKPETRNQKPDAISISDVLVGEVWVGSGQSNMEVADYAETNFDALKKTWADLQPDGLQSFKQARETALAVEADQIRLTDMRATWLTPQWAPWVVPKKFTGELAYFALRLHQELKVPIGLIQTAKGGSPAAVWVTPEMLADCPEFMADTYVSQDKRLTPTEKIGSEYRQRLADRLVPYAKHVIEGATVRVSFEHVGQGLVFKTNDTVKALQGFALAGEDKVFHWAAASHDPAPGSGQAADTVVLTCPAVPQPVAVRYAWSSNRPWANLFNKDGLPSKPFRTDT
jgi:sialate O-acetylesterase